MMEINVHLPLGGGCEVKVLDSGSGVATGGSRPTPLGTSSGGPSGGPSRTPPGTPPGTPSGWIPNKAVDSGFQCRTILKVDLNTSDHWLQNLYYMYTCTQMYNV